MSPARTRSGRVLLSPSPPRPRVYPTRARQTGGQLVVLDVAEEVQEEPDVEDTVNAVHERSNSEDDLVEIIEETVQGQPEGNNVDELVNVDIADDANSNETIEIIGEEVNDSVIDLTNDTNGVSNSPVRVGGNWTNTPFHLARLPPNPRTPLHPPVMVDLTNSPVNHLDKTFPPIDMDTTSSPGNLSLQCPVCLDSLKSIKRTGRGMMSTVCGHIFCSKCLPASIKANGRCPTCRKVLAKKDYHKIFI